jgi:hypothetical protein
MKAISLGGGGLLASAASTHGAKVSRAMSAVRQNACWRQDNMRKDHLGLFSFVFFDFR